MRTGLWLAAVVAAVVAAAPAHADTESCDRFRNDILAMERTSVRPQGFLELNILLRDTYRESCISSPTRDPSKGPTQYWYRANGSPTGVPTDAARPADASYVATEEIGRFCAGQPMDPSMCAMLAGIGHYCSTAPARSLLMRQCGSIDPDLPEASDPLPPEQLSIAGKTYTVGRKCARFLAEVQATDPRRAPIAVGQDGWQHRLRLVCPAEFADAAAKMLGRTPDQSDFWPAFGRLALNGFRSPAERNYTPTSLRNNPDFNRMCNQAKSFRDQCWNSWNNMRSIGTQALGDTGQAGAFKECYGLYAKVYGLCEAGQREANRIGALPQLLPNPEPAIPPTPVPGASRPPPQQPPQPPQMSARCQQLVSNYVSAAQANDGPRALAGYNALKSAGGCNVLDKVDRAPPPVAGGDSRFISRGARPNIEGTIGACDRATDGCAEAMRQLEQAASPAAQAAMIMNAVQVGLELGAAMASGLAAMQPRGGGGGGTNYNSIGNRPAARTYGQGSAQPAPSLPQQPPVSCGSGPVCTAR
jgi:hypothetical protein